MQQQDKILINTIAQYIRVILVIFISLYSTRVILIELGSSDFGLYSLIGSLLTLLSLLNSSMSRTTQRFLSLYIGRNDTKEHKKVLFNSILLHFVISIIILIIFIGAKPLLFNGYLQIEPEKITTAKTLYTFAALSTLITINTTPYNAVLISHENIIFTSITHIATASIRLGIAIALQFIESDKLLSYGAMMCGVSIIEFFIYVTYSRYNYAECSNFMQFSLFDKQIIKSLLSFSKWSLYGTICVLSRTQGYAIILNRLIGLTANTSYGLATQVSGQINNLAYSISNAISPIIMRSEGANDRAKMVYLSIESSKISFLMLTIVGLPVIFEIQYILKMWLGELPVYAVYFICSIIIASFFDSLASGLRTGIQAIGSLKKFSLIVYSTKIVTIPLAIILFKLTQQPKIILFPFILTEIIGTYFTIIIFCRYINYPIKEYFFNLSSKISPPLLCSITVCLVVVSSMEQSIMRIVMTFILSITTTVTVVYFHSLNKRERGYLTLLFKRIWKL